MEFNSTASKVMLRRLQFVEETEVSEILKRDSQNLGIRNTDRFVKMNLTQAYLVINIWTLIVYDVSGGNLVLLSDFVRFIADSGLYGAIDACAKYADQLVHTADQTVSDCYHVDTRSQAYEVEQVTAPDVLIYVCHDKPIEKCLELLRFPKRFTWVAADELADLSIRKMRDINIAIYRKKAISPYGVEQYKYSSFIIDRMRHYYASALVGLIGFYRDELPVFSSGVCRYAKTLEEKLAFVGQYQKFWVLPGMPLVPYITHRDKRDDSIMEIQEPEPPHGKCIAVEAIAVPKSYKSYRIITPLAPINAMELQRVRKAWERALEVNGFTQYFDVTSQDRNRELALRGSTDGSYTTVDMSSASDSISRELAYSLMPHEVVDLIDPFMERWIDWRYANGSEGGRECYMFGTSGNPITFVHEGTFFMSGCLTANDIFNQFLKAEDEEPALPPSIFGDDMSVDTRVYELLADILRHLGCYLNAEKTFSDGFYRESCGSEYYAGLDVASLYWPRRGFKSSQFKRESRDFPETVSSLCSLQHRLWSFPTARLFLESYIRKLVPDMTSSTVGSECTDLWANVPQFGKRSAPHKGEIAPSSVTLREAHYGLAVQKSDLRDDVNVESYLYILYLKYGPQLSEDPLCRSLGLTEPRTVQRKGDVTVLKKLIK